MTQLDAVGEFLKEAGKPDLRSKGMVPVILGMNCRNPVLWVAKELAEDCVAGMSWWDHVDDEMRKAFASDTDKKLNGGE